MSISRQHLKFKPSLCMVLLTVLLVALWFAGGSSRADVLGQAVVRAIAWAVLVCVILFQGRFSIGAARPVGILLLAAILLAWLQLVPLPPNLWLMLPGRDMLAEAAVASSQSQPWRPWSIVPGATVNAVSSLVVPLATFAVLMGLEKQERSWLPGLILGLISASTFIGLLQFSGANIGNPFINDATGQVTGTFANRNHFALFLAFGCIVAPVWAFLDGRQPHWRGPVALGLVVLFTLTILASGSRAGLFLGFLGVVFALVLVRKDMRRALSRYPRWVFPAVMVGVVGLVSTFVLISVAADRAVSIDRLFALDPGQDKRGRALPTVLAMIQEYFPAGSGLGGFDPIFRMHEPFQLLEIPYFNHAHNDLVEIVLDAGLPGLLLLLGGVLWWAWGSLRAWRAGSSARYAIPKLGSATLFLVLVASIVDYPARTPMIMTMIVIAGVWLSSAEVRAEGSALPKSRQPL